MKTIVMKLGLFELKREAKWRAIESRMKIRELRRIRTHLKGSLYRTNVAFAERGLLRNDCDSAIELYIASMSRFAAIARSLDYIEAHAEYVAARTLLADARKLHRSVKSGPVGQYRDRRKLARI